MLSAQQAQIKEERSTKKAPFTDAEVAALLGTVETVQIARGAKVVTSPASAVALDDLKGPTGNYRAPIVRQGRTLLIGFSREALERLL